jgi:hypothetical protein
MTSGRSFVVLLAALAALACGLSQTASGQATPQTKKLIATGWDHANPQRLLENLAAMEDRPFDGVVADVSGTRDDGRECLLRWAFLDESWRREWFREDLERLKACRCRKFTDNFILFGANPGSVDWFDDAGWRNVVEHWRIAAWLAREAGFRGILFDPEPYSRPHAQFEYDAQPEHDRHTFDEYSAMARRRGREVIEAVAAEYPDLTLFSYFMNSVVAGAARDENPRAVLATSGYGLFPAFLDGWLDAAPPEMTFVDGCETAYLYNSRQQYLESAVRIKGACQSLVSPENRAKYRAQVEVGFGVYLDAYWNPKDSEWGRWYIDGEGGPAGPRIERLRANVGDAMDVADRYVWIYGEKFRWWPTDRQNVKQETWPEALPGCDEILRYLRDPIGFARRRVAELRRESNDAANLLENGRFQSDLATSANGSKAAWRKGGPPAGWHAWQNTGSQGTFTWDRDSGAAEAGSARAAGAAEGCFLQHVAVEPHQRYAVLAVRKIQGRGDAWLRVRWQTPDGAWTAEPLDKVAVAAGPLDAWAEMFAVVDVPESAGRLVVLLGVNGQESPDDAAWFDDVEVYRLP